MNSYNYFALYEFIVYVGPWIIFALICLIIAIFKDVRIQILYEKLKDKDKIIAYYIDKDRLANGKKIIKTANDAYNSVSKKTEK